MKTVLRIANLNTNEDVISIKEVIAHSEGTIACEVNLNKKEVSIEKQFLLTVLINSYLEIILPKITNGGNQNLEQKENGHSNMIMILQKLNMILNTKMHYLNGNQIIQLERYNL